MCIPNLNQFRWPSELAIIRKNKGYDPWFFFHLYRYTPTVLTLNLWVDLKLSIPTRRYSVVGVLNMTVSPTAGTLLHYLPFLIALTHNLLKNIVEKTATFTRSVVLSAYQVNT